QIEEALRRLNGLTHTPESDPFHPPSTTILKRCTTAAANKRSLKDGDPISYSGVRRRESGRYTAEIRDPQSKAWRWLGTYDMAEKAAFAYDCAARAIRGVKARTNFDYFIPPFNHTERPDGRALASGRVFLGGQVSFLIRSVRTISVQHRDENCLGATVDSVGTNGMGVMTVWASGRWENGVRMRLNGLTHTPESDPLHPPSTTILKRCTTAVANKRSLKDGDPIRYRGVRRRESGRTAEFATVNRAVTPLRYETLSQKGGGGLAPSTRQRGGVRL
ncbi:hypothetical protein U1Q18_010350, partial [Sarracenia purpurea var. burkii]